MDGEAVACDGDGVPVFERPGDRRPDGRVLERVRGSAYSWHNKRSPHRLMIFFTRIRETDQIFAHVENKSAKRGPL
jgi:hypothetical protein